MAVVLVDGWPTDKVEEASRLARESGINIFFVTIEGPDDNEKQNLVEANFVAVCRLFLMDLEHADHNFTDPSSVELSTVFLRALTAPFFFLSLWLTAIPP